MALSEQDLQMFWQSMPQQTKKAPVKKKKNFWLDQLSTVGGIAGGIGGSLVAPIAGTAVGAGAGSALGEALENLISGESVTKNLAKEGALGAVFGAGPIKLAKGAIAGGSSLAKTGSLGLAKEAASTAAKTPLRQGLGESLSGTADNLAVKQFRLTPSQIANFKKKFKEDPGTLIRKYGFSNVDDITAKGIEPLQQQFDEAIGGITGVTKESLKKSIDSRIAKLAGAASTDNKAIGKQLQSESKQLLKKYGDVIDANELNTIRKEFDSLVNYTNSVANPAKYGVNKRMADALRETLQNSDQTGALKGVGRELQKLRQLADNAAKQGELGRGSLPLGLTNLLGGVVGSSGGMAGAAGGIMAAQAVNSGAGRRALMGGVSKAGSKLASTPESINNPMSIAKRVGGVGALTGLSNQSVSNSEANTSASITSNAPPMNANMGSLSPQGGEMSNPYGISEQSYLEAIITDIQETGGENMGMLKTLYEQFGPQAQGQKPVSAEAAKTITNAQTGLQALNDFESIVANDPSALQKSVIPGRGVAGGLLGRALGTQSLDASRQQVIDIIARLRTGAAITASEEARFMQFLPVAADTPDVAAQKIGYLRNQFSDLLNRVNGGTQPSTLEDALMSQAL